MKGIYKIKNIITEEYYIGSSIDINRRILAHKIALRKNIHYNFKLQKSYNEYGAESFVFYELKIISEESTNIELIKLEQHYIDNSDTSKLFNIKLIATISKLIPIIEDCYVLNLEGELIRDFNSISECFRWLQVGINGDIINSPNIIKNKYRVVTREYFENNYKSIENWGCGDGYVKKVSIKTCKLYCDLDGKTLEFNNYKHLSTTLNITQSKVISILKGKSKKNANNIRIIK